jgi:hypothetical protein
MRGGGNGKIRQPLLVFPGVRGLGVGVSCGMNPAVSLNGRQGAGTAYHNHCCYSFKQSLTPSVA